MSARLPARPSSVSEVQSEMLQPEVIQSRRGGFTRRKFHQGGDRRRRHRIGRGIPVPRQRGADADALRPGRGRAAHHPQHQRAAAPRGRPEARDARHDAPLPARPHRDQAGLRPGGMRRLHVLLDGVTHYGCSILTHSVAGREVTTDRGAGAGRGAAPGPAGGHRRGRLPVRVLRAGLRDEHGRHAGQEPGSDQGRGGGSALGQPLPLRRLRQDPEYGYAGGRAVPFPGLRGESRWLRERSAPTSPHRIFTRRSRGGARYAEDFHAEGMAFAKLLLSPMPHARVRSVDTSRAEAMEGVLGILRASELPRPEQGTREGALSDEPLYEGAPILAVAAVDETTAAAAVEAIRVDLEPLPFVLDPLDSLREGGANARTGRQRPRRGRADVAQVARQRLRGRGIGPAAHGRADGRVGHRRRGRGVRRGRCDRRRDHRPSVGHAPPHGAPLLHGVLAERQALPARLHAEHGAHAGTRGRDGGRRCRGRGDDRRVLRRRLRQQDRGRAHHGGARCTVPQDRPTGHAADHALRGELHRAGARRLPGLGQDRIPAATAA